MDQSRNRFDIIDLLWIKQETRDNEDAGWNANGNWRCLNDLTKVSCQGRARYLQQQVRVIAKEFLMIRHFSDKNISADLTDQAMHFELGPVLPALHPRLLSSSCATDFYREYSKRRVYQIKTRGMALQKGMN